MRGHFNNLIIISLTKIKKSCSCLSHRGGLEGGRKPKREEREGNLVFLLQNWSFQQDFVINLTEFDGNDCNGQENRSLGLYRQKNNNNKTKIKLSPLKEFKDYIGQLHIYTCKEREREREREIWSSIAHARQRFLSIFLFVSLLLSLVQHDDKASV